MLKIYGHNHITWTWILAQMQSSSTLPTLVYKHLLKLRQQATTVFIKTRDLLSKPYIYQCCLLCRYNNKKKSTVCHWNFFHRQYIVNSQSSIVSKKLTVSVKKSVLGFLMWNLTSWMFQSCSYFLVHGMIDPWW